MPNENDWLDLQHTVERHEADLDANSTELAKLRAALPMLIEAIEALDMCALDGMAHTTRGEQARKRIKEIIAILKPSAPPK